MNEEKCRRLRYVGLYVCTVHMYVLHIWVDERGGEGQTMLKRHESMNDQSFVLKVLKTNKMYKFEFKPFILPHLACCGLFIWFFDF